MRSARFRKPACIAAAVLLALVSGAGLLPPVRQALVHFMEARYMHRALNMNYWTQQLFALSFIVFALDLLCCLAFATGRGRSLCRELAGELRSRARSLYAERKAVLILFCLYAFGMLTVFRANYYYGAADDLYRAISGARAWRNFYRYISHFLSIFVHTSPKLFDIAPFTQLLALLVMALSAVLLIRLFVQRDAPGTAPAAGTEAAPGSGAAPAPAVDSSTVPAAGTAPAAAQAARPLSPFVYLAAIPVCLFPYFLENLSYRYDAPYMALSVFFCILPFLFTDRLRIFAPVSLVSLFLMCLSYQAASGVYIVVCAFCVFRMWCRKECSLRRLLLFILTAVAAYALSLLIFFAIFNVQPTGESYVDKNFFISAFPRNAKAYLAQIWDDFGWSALKIAFLFLLFFFVLLSCRNSRQKRLATLFVSLLLIAFSTLFSYGAFLVMGRPLLEPRSMFPFGIMLSLMTLSVAGWTGPAATPGTAAAQGENGPAAETPATGTAAPREATRGKPRGCLPACGRAVIVILAYSMIVYAFAFGNAQASQKKYTDFRMTLLLEDLSRIVPEDQNDIHIHLLSDIDHTRIVRNLATTYPLTTRMIEKLGGHAVIFHLQDLGFGIQAETDKYTPWDLEFPSYPLQLNTRYHTIYAKDNVYYVYFKNPPVTLRE